MTDNEIIKALECCKKAKLNQDCLDLKCPFATEYGCNIDQEDLRNKALDLINSQKAEIERLQKEFDIMRFTTAKRWVKEAKSEAIKEFAEKSENRLIELYEKYHKIANKPKKETDMFYQARAEAIWECINTNRNLVKEMEGE